MNVKHTISEINCFKAYESARTFIKSLLIVLFRPVIRIQRFSSLSYYCTQSLAKSSDVDGKISDTITFNSFNFERVTFEGWGLGG